MVSMGLVMAVSEVVGMWSVNQISLFTITNDDLQWLWTYKAKRKVIILGTLDLKFETYFL